MSQLDKKLVEAVLFAVGKYIREKEIAKLINTTDYGAVGEALDELKQEYNNKDSSLIVFNEGDNWKLTVREEFMPVVQKIISRTELSKSVMETLAVIAWKTPCKQSDLIDIRSSKAYDHINELAEKDFITKEKHGRTYVLKLTKKFYDYFDIEGKKDLKDIFSNFENDEELQKELDDFEKYKHPDHLGKLRVYDVSGEEQEEEKQDVRVVPVKDSKSKNDVEVVSMPEEKPKENYPKGEEEDKNGQKEIETGEEESSEEETAKDNKEEIEKKIKKKKEIDSGMPNLDEAIGEEK